MNTKSVPNVLIDRHQSNMVKGYPLPEQYPNTVAFLYAHRQWLTDLRIENFRSTMKLMRAIRKEKDSYVLAHLSGILHIRKEYSAFLRRGIAACNDFIKEPNNG